MGIEINLSDLNISGNAKVMDDMEIRSSDDVRISLEHIEIREYAKVLNHLEIAPVLNELRQQAQSMDKKSAEYLKINEIVSAKRWNKEEFIRCAIKHISEFSKGVLASVVANYMAK